MVLFSTARILSKKLHQSWHSRQGNGLLLCFLLCCGGLPAQAQSDSAPDDRQRFIDARKAIQQNREADALEHMAALTQYPLYPYLTYYQLSRKLGSLPYPEVDAFLDQHRNTYLGDRLQRQWLSLLAARKRWHEYQSYFDPARADTAQTCTWLMARLNTGEEAALAEVEPLWNVGRSQPKVCDPLFKQWQASVHYTPALAWSRAVKAIESRNRSLARFIGKYAPEPAKADIERLVWLDRYPSEIRHTRKYGGNDSRSQYVVMHAIARLARTDAKQALQLWERYDANGLYPDQARRELQEQLTLYLSRQGHDDHAHALASSMTDGSSEKLQETLLRQALENGHWQRVQAGIRELPAPLQDSDRWRYWQLRAAEQLGQNHPPFAKLENEWQQLAQKRSFYGFLAADRLGLSYAMEDEPSMVERADQEWVANHDGLARARELYALDQVHEARQEWLYASRSLSPAQLQAAGNLAAQWGWHRSGIQAMIDAQAWNDLQVRFPRAYEDIVERQAHSQDVDPNLLFAIARQESAFAPDARSSAGAMGLMQLMPATARQTARKAGIRYNTPDLLTPETNIALGSRYFKEMLSRFENNAAHAAAAYNAGPHRVDRWLADGRDQLPADVWIETIPFTETRGYVQNVMVFSVIYAYRGGVEPESLKGRMPVSLDLPTNPVSSFQGQRPPELQASP
ncbi:transglycosylase SLT domain-containing protein [Simiduia agarivorans]|uniref:Lytic murein transglycosylase n=1 Tax=Simiduia agarivorans (strain DSM 21679 / JCM 13881 / BCRC 17597 / SA1) TaxID=1117647 RepID=K4KHK9_SIMAS|nr:transglycosylase SLT domain-containing protein [Simiduia agarivorans]AFU97453.1 lytic murein transglycosylase [Simiduia agarivorans SA1 = DSM 21679]